MADLNEIRNQVLRSLDIADFRLLQSHLTRIEFKLGDPFETAGVPIRRVYFPESGLASIVVRFAPRHDIEVGVAGRENMTGAALVLGDSQSPFECMAQMPGTAFSITATDLTIALNRSPTLARHMIKFARALSIQTAFTAHVNGHETIVPRLARWLLMLHDRVDGDGLSITHNFLSTMMGVRRQSVTEALHILEGKHLIVANRAFVEVRDREGMIAVAGTAYGSAEKEYTRLTGQPLSK